MKQMNRTRVGVYEDLLADVARMIEDARRAAARSVNAVMATTYWFVGRRIVEQEQKGAARAVYGERLLERLARDLSRRFGRGFSQRNLEQMRAFYLGWQIPQTAPAKLLASAGAAHGSHISQTTSAELVDAPSERGHSRFPLPWSHYTRLLAVRNENARCSRESEALCGGWTIRQLDRQIQSQFYDSMSARHSLSTRKPSRSDARAPGAAG